MQSSGPKSQQESVSPSQQNHGETYHEVGQWIPARDFLTDSECTIEIANIYTVRIRRVHDSILMEDAMTGKFTDGEIQAINRCRLYPSGRMSLRYLHSCRLDDRSRTANNRQGRLPVGRSRVSSRASGKRSWAVWRQFLKPYTRDSTSNRLRQH
jgi:hypothetical protein